MFGNLIFFFVLSLIPAGLMEGNMEQNILLIALVLVGLVVFYRIRKKQKTRKQVN
jgi:preprotein translocase subunit YajC